MPKGREDSESEESYLDDFVIDNDRGTNEPDGNKVHGTAMKKNNEFSISDRTPYSREASRSIEWTFFENIGQWKSVAF